MISIHAQPGAKRTEVAGIHGDALRIRIHAPPLEGRANDALLEFIAQRLGLANRNVALLAGEKSREKKVAVPATCNPEKLLAG